MSARSPFDINRDGKMDANERTLEFMVISECSKQEERSSSENRSKKANGKVFYDASSEHPLVTVLKCLLAIAFCVGGIVIPIKSDMGALGFGLLAVCGALLGAAILKNC